MSVVVDASVAIKWYLLESNSEDALRLTTREQSLLAPELMFAEIGNVLWKRANRGDITPELAEAIVRSFVTELPLRVTFHSLRSLLPTALAIAETTGASAYDAMYVALAVREDTVCVTADRKLYERMRSTDFRERVRWIEDW